MPQSYSQLTTVRSLAGAAQILLSAVRDGYKKPGDAIRNIEPSVWPSPLNPVAPIGAPGSEPIAWPFFHGQNLIFQPRPDATYTAADLRNFATYELVRVIIENTKDNVSRVPMRIQAKPQPGETNKDREKREAGDKSLLELQRFFEFPDGENDWVTWQRPLLDDMLVLDAASVLIQRTYGGKIVGLNVIPGDGIVRYIDQLGYTPRPPDPAYAQLWNGAPRVNLTTDELLYKPRNIVHRNTVSSHLYGYSPTEQCVTWLKIGIERLAFQLAYYTEGSIPGVVQVVPADTTPKKIAETMMWMNSELAGDLAKRRQWRMVQSLRTDGKDDQILFTKEALLTDPFDDLIIRVLCFTFGTSPQRLMKMIRTEGQASQDASVIEGLWPWLVWRDSLVNTILRKMGVTDYEAKSEPDVEADPLKRAQADNIEVPKIRTINEGRRARGLDPMSDPNADKLGTWTATGFVAIDAPPPPKPTAPVGGKPANAIAKPPNGKPAPAADKVMSTATLGFSPVEVAGERGVFKARKPSFRPGDLTPASKRAETRIAASLRGRFGTIEHRLNVAVAEHAARKADDPLAREIEIILDEELRKLIPDLETALGSAAASGADEGLTIQLEIDDANLLATVNETAREWASKRAAELVGMVVNEDGALVPNPNAEMTISEPTREKLREIVKESFEADSPIGELHRRIQEAGVFSSERAATIARTEVERAQVAGNFEAWQASGVVQSIRWLTSEDEGVCEECEQNDEEVVELGAAFPSGDQYPPVHPNCRCVVAAETIDTIEED